MKMHTWIPIGLVLVAGVACAEPLTEASIRGVVKARTEAIGQKDLEAVMAAYSMNAVIGMSLLGMSETDSDVDAHEFFEEMLDDLESITLDSSPTEIRFGDAATSAVVTVETRASFPLEDKRPRTIVLNAIEILDVIESKSGPKIDYEVINVSGFSMEPDELAKRIMTVKQQGGLDKETAIKLMEESGCQYREGDGKSKKTSISTSGWFYFFGDDSAILAAAIPGMQVLDFDFGSITDKGLAHIGTIDTLQSLSVMGTSISEAGIKHLENLSELTSLSLTATGINDAALKRIASLPSLESLEIMGAPKLTEAGLIHLSQSETLEKVALTIHMTDVGLEHLSAIPNLSALNLSHAAVTDAGLTSVEKMEQLKSITLSNTEVTHVGARQLKAKRPKLRIYPPSLVEPCVDSRQRLEYAKKYWAQNEKKKQGDTPTREDLEPFLMHRGGFESLICEDGGTFSINAIGVGAECSIHGKTTPKKPVEQLKGLSKEDYDIDGAKVGRWTMDLAAAKSLAAEKQLPILINFTGSDWCYWCKLMEKNVFTKPEWNAYATHHIVMVLIDFPRDKTAVPEKYKERNNTLKGQYEISGYPTFVLLKPDGKIELGRLKAGRNKTPASFIEEINRSTSKTEAGEAE